LSSIWVWSWLAYYWEQRQAHSYLSDPLVDRISGRTKVKGSCNQVHGGKHSCVWSTGWTSVSKFTTWVWACLLNTILFSLGLQWEFITSNLGPKAPIKDLCPWMATKLFACLCGRVQFGYIS
jgi:hypothetical protein